MFENDTKKSPCNLQVDMKEKENCISIKFETSIFRYLTNIIDTSRKNLSWTVRT